VTVPSGDEVIYKIVTAEQWTVAEQAGVFKGAPVDLADGFIHFSTAGQVRETAARHFRGQEGLLLVSVAPPTLGADLRYEPARGGQLFPHLHADLPLSAVIAAEDLPLGADGRHRFPESIP
jgi:uncharacterized protein (DUF952 family)